MFSLKIRRCKILDKFHVWCTVLLTKQTYLSTWSWLFFHAWYSPGCFNVAACCWPFTSPRAREEGQFRNLIFLTCILQFICMFTFLQSKLCTYLHCFDDKLFCSIFSFFGNLFRPRRPNQGGVPVISPQGYVEHHPPISGLSYLFFLVTFWWNLNRIFTFTFSFRVRPLITLDERPRNVAAASENRWENKHWRTRKR